MRVGTENVRSAEWFRVAKGQTDTPNPRFRRLGEPEYLDGVGPMHDQVRIGDLAVEGWARYLTDVRDPEKRMDAYVEAEMPQWMIDRIEKALREG